MNIVDGYDAQEQCQLDVLHFGVGDISENDVNMAEMFSGNLSRDTTDITEPDRKKSDVFFALFLGSVYGFNVRASKSIQRLAARCGVPLRLHTIIYKMINELKEELSAKLPPLISENVIGEFYDVKTRLKIPAGLRCRVSDPLPGEATVLATFDVTVGKKKVPVAGCRVQKGQLDRRMKFRLMRGQDAIWAGE